MSVRVEILEAAGRAMLADLRAWGISQRQAAKQLGIAVSTLNALLNCQYNTQHRATLEKLLAGAIWSPLTRQKLQTLLDYEALAFRGELDRPVLRVISGGKD